MLLIGKHLQTVNRLRQKEKGPAKTGCPSNALKRTAAPAAECFIDPFAHALRVRTLPSSLLPALYCLLAPDVFVWDWGGTQKKYEAETVVSFICLMAKQKDE